MRSEIWSSGVEDNYFLTQVFWFSVFLRAANNAENQNKFTHFIISVINENPEKNIASETSIGSMQLYGDALTKFSDSCQNAVVETDNQPKAEIQVWGDFFFDKNISSDILQTNREYNGSL